MSNQKFNYIEIKVFNKMRLQEGCRNGSAVRCTHFSEREPEFGAQHPYVSGSSQTPITPAPWDLMPFSGVHLHICIYPHTFSMSEMYMGQKTVIPNLQLRKSAIPLIQDIKISKQPSSWKSGIRHL